MNKPWSEQFEREANNSPDLMGVIDMYNTFRGDKGHSVALWLLCLEGALTSAHAQRKSLQDIISRLAMQGNSNAEHEVAALSQDIMQKAEEVLKALRETASKSMESKG